MGNDFKRKELKNRRYEEGIFNNEGGETLVQAPQRGGRYPIPGNILSQIGWSLEKHVLIKDVPAHSRGVALDDLYGSFPIQPILRFYDFERSSCLCLLIL